MYFTAEPSTLTGEAENVICIPGLLPRKRACLTGTSVSSHISELHQVLWPRMSHPVCFLDSALVLLECVLNPFLYGVCG